MVEHWEREKRSKHKTWWKRATLILIEEIFVAEILQKIIHYL